MFLRVRASPFRYFSTAKVATVCGFSEDFPAIIKTTSVYNKALYNHLRGVNMKDKAMQDEFMRLTTLNSEDQDKDNATSDDDKDDKESKAGVEKSQNDLGQMRKTMAKQS